MIGRARTMTCAMASVATHGTPRLRAEMRGLEGIHPEPFQLVPVPYLLDCMRPAGADAGRRQREPLTKAAWMPPKQYITR